MRRILVALAVLGVALPTSAPAAPSSGCGPGTALESESVRIWFQGFKGHIKVQHRDDDAASYTLKTAALTERTQAGDVATMNLERAYPQDAQSCSVTTEGDETRIRFGVTADVRAVAPEGSAAQGGNVLGQATVTFVFHFDTEDNGAKFDLLVDDWPWASADGLLMFGFTVEAPEATVEPAANGIGFRDDEGTPRGHISWAPEFDVTYEDGSEQSGTAEALTQPDGSRARVDLSFTGVDAGYAELRYDPWMGVGAYVVVGPLLIGDSVLAAVMRRLAGP